jgi:hypothetical protein
LREARTREFGVLIAVRFCGILVETARGIEHPLPLQTGVESASFNRRW